MSTSLFLTLISFITDKVCESNAAAHYNSYFRNRHRLTSVTLTPRSRAILTNRMAQSWDNALRLYLSLKGEKYSINRIRTKCFSLKNCLIHVIHNSLLPTNQAGYLIIYSFAMTNFTFLQGFVL